MNIPKDISEKYNFLKQQTFENLGLPFIPGVITYTAPPNTVSSSHNGSDTATNYSSNNYTSNGGFKGKSTQDQQFTQIEEIIKGLNEHLSNMTKGIILEEDNSFIQESLSKKFLEPLIKKDYYFTQIPKEFLNRIDSIKFEFDKEIRKLVDHFAHQREELCTQNERKIELLKQESNKYKMEVQNIKSQIERQCRCKYYEETLGQMKDENERYIDKLKQKYENEIYEIRNKQQNGNGNLDSYREKIFTDITDRVLSFVQERHNAYLNSFCQENGITDIHHQVDPIDILFYICQRLQGDNNWLVDKLAEVQERSSIQPYDQNPNSQLFKDLVEQTKLSSQILDNFNFQRNEFLASLDNNQPIQTQGKENMPLKKLNNYNSVRDSIQSARSSNKPMGKSQSGKNINHKFQQIQKMDGGYNDYGEEGESRQMLEESREYYRDINQ